MPREIFGARYYSSKEAAELLGFARTTILKWCREESFGKKFGRDYLIAEETIRAKLGAAEAVKVS